MRSEARRPVVGGSVTARLGRLGTPPSRHYDLGARSCPKSPRWSAERRASRVISAFTRVLTRYGTQGASQAPGLLRHEQAQRVPLHPNDSRRSAHPSIRVGEAKL